MEIWSSRGCFSPSFTSFRQIIRVTKNPAVGVPMAVARLAMKISRVGDPLYKKQMTQPNTMQATHSHRTSLLSRLTSLSSPAFSSTTPLWVFPRRLEKAAPRSARPMTRLAYPPRKGRSIAASWAGALIRSPWGWRTMAPTSTTAPEIRITVTTWAMASASMVPLNMSFLFHFFSAPR